MMMRMWGGSTMLAKYCRKGRHYSSSSSNNNKNNRVREVKTLKEVSEGLVAMMARPIPDAIKSLAFKTGIFYFGYAAGNLVVVIGRIGFLDPTVLQSQLQSNVLNLLPKNCLYWEVYGYY